MVHSHRGNFVYIPMTEVAIMDTWYTVGMQGTSSDSVAVKDLFVPAHRLVAADKTFGYRGPGKKHVGAPSDNWQVFPLIRAAGLGQLVGAVEAALELALDGAQRKPVPNTTLCQTDELSGDPAQSGRGRGEDRCRRAARRFTVRGAGPKRRSAAAHSHLWSGPGKKRAARSRSIFSAPRSKNHVRRGSSAFARANELQRFWRDFNMAARHAIYLPDFGYEVYGAMRLGITQTAVPPNLV